MSTQLKICHPEAAFSQGGFTPFKWNSNAVMALQHEQPELRDSILDPHEYAKNLGMQWNIYLDHFKLALSESPKNCDFTKRLLVFDIAKTFDVLG